MSCNSNCSDLGSHELVECGAYLVGGISALGFLECDENIITDYTSAAQISAAIAAGQLAIIKSLRGEIPDASPVDGDSASACSPDQEVYNYDRTLTWTDHNYTSNNIDFYNGLKRRGYKVLAYNCEDATLTVIDVFSLFTVTSSNPNTKKTRRMFKGIAKWTEYDEPQVYSLGTAAAALFQ